MEEKTGIPLVQQAVTEAAHAFGILRGNNNLDERDRRMCDEMMQKLIRAEKVLYGR